MTLPQLVHALVEKNAERAHALASYRGTRTYTLTYKGIPNLHAAMIVEMTYKAPATKEFTITSQSGSELLVHKVLKKLLTVEQDAQRTPAETALNEQNYTFSNMEYSPAKDGCSYIVSVEPRTSSKLLYRGRIWIHADYYAVCRIEGEPARNPSFWIRSTALTQTYFKTDGFWLPEKNETVSHIRVGGVATLSILYNNYRSILAAP